MSWVQMCIRMHLRPTAPKETLGADTHLEHPMELPFGNTDHRSLRSRDLLSVAGWSTLPWCFGSAGEQDRPGRRIVRAQQVLRLHGETCLPQPAGYPRWLAIVHVRMRGLVVGPS